MCSYPKTRAESQVQVCLLPGRIWAHHGLNAFPNNSAREDFPSDFREKVWLSLLPLAFPWRKGKAENSEHIFHLAFKIAPQGKGMPGHNHFLATQYLSHEDRAMPGCLTSCWTAPKWALPLKLKQNALSPLVHLPPHPSMLQCQCPARKAPSCLLGIKN